MAKHSAWTEGDVATIPGAVEVYLVARHLDAAGDAWWTVLVRSNRFEVREDRLS